MWRRLNLCPDNGTTLEPCNSSRVKVRYHALIGIYCYLICILHYSDIQSFAFPPPSHIETFISPSSHIETFISPSSHIETFISPSSHIETFISPFSHIETYISLSSRIWPPNSLSQTYTVSPLLNDLLCSSPPPISPCPPPPLFGRQVSLDYPNISIWPLWPVPQTYSSSSRYSLDSPGDYTLLQVL